jgi:deazaflavin-dependent oxidoreductase (nitroreductase family)
MFPRAMARVNRVLTNRFIRPVAYLLPPFAVVEHRGRRTGRAYRTPVFAFRRGGEVVVVLSYGAGSDWPQNLVAAGGGGMIRLAHHQSLAEIRIVPVADAGPLSPLGRFACRFAAHALLAKTGLAQADRGQEPVS